MENSGLPEWEQGKTVVVIKEAVEAGDTDRIREALAKDPSLARARVHYYEPGKTTLLNRAAWHRSSGHLVIAKLLIEHVADVDAVGNEPNNRSCAPLTITGW